MLFYHKHHINHSYHHHHDHQILAKSFHSSAMAGRPGQPEGESEIDFNAVEFALSLKTD